MELIKTYDKIDDYSDPDKATKDVLTEFVNKYFLPTASLGRFIDLTMSTVENELEHVRRELLLRDDAVFLAFKGGNVLHLINQNRKKFMPELVNIVINAYDPYLRQSDNDFSVYVNPHLSHYEYVLEMVEKRTMMALDKIRRKYMRNKSTYFPFFNRMDQKSLMMKLALQLGVKSVRMSKTSDVLIKTTEDGRIGVYSEGGKPNVFYNSLNLALNFDKGGGRIVFDLARTKVHFKVGKGTSNGELIDISFPRREDANMMDIDDWNDFVKTNFKKMKKKGRVVSLKYLEKDLINMLFYQSGGKPWTDKKYAKRINRLFYVGLMIDLNSAKVTKQSIEDMQIQYANFTKSPKFRKLQGLLTRAVNMGDRDGQVLEVRELMSHVDRNVSLVLQILQKMLEFMKGYILSDMYKTDVFDF